MHGMRIGGFFYTKSIIALRACHRDLLHCHTVNEYILQERNFFDYSIDNLNNKESYMGQSPFNSGLLIESSTKIATNEGHKFVHSHTFTNLLGLNLDINYLCKLLRSYFSRTL